MRISAGGEDIEVFGSRLESSVTPTPGSAPSAHLCALKLCGGLRRTEFAPQDQLQTFWS